jgi:hypothetical protein
MAFDQNAMSKMIMILQAGNVKLLERHVAPPVTACQRSTVGRSLSLLSLKIVVDVYPDTGESGDAYDIEAIRNH